ncbi:sulfatase-like hydrolase/transferase [Rubinisphaera italica]|uniref:Arylsulfatase n=1 Tax=Rubinisphaera italica TaxID=2527969 RepID=A0A5C5XNK5_9PLAN|nr:sulfatase-like hydrolase/transferase [Rubinisphaera italica]TWT63953.1 Arylsulfatase [Rubinisphaera italica]
MQSHYLLMLCFLTNFLVNDPQIIVAEDRPHVVFIVADDLQADVISVYGGPVPTPHLQELANRGCRFQRATCGYPICHVSRTEFLSGRSVVTEATPGKVIQFPPEWTLWPAWMQKHGWETVHSGKWHVNGQPHQRGFDRTAGLYSSGGAKGQPLTLPISSSGHSVTGYRGWTFKADSEDGSGKPLPELGIGLMPDTDLRIANAAIKQINQTGESPLFLTVNFTAPHDPLHWSKGWENSFQASEVTLPVNFLPKHPFDHGNQNGRDEMIIPAPRTRESVQLQRSIYYALVANIDEQVGRIAQALQSRDMLEETIFIFTSDQGLALGSHGLMGKQNQYEHTTNVPLIITGPGLPAGKTIDSNCALRDLYPTVCELCQLETPESVQGKSLVSLWNASPVDEARTTYGYFTDTQRMIRDDEDWKLIWYPQQNLRQLFHLTADPHEMNNLAADPNHAGRLKKLSQQLTNWLTEQKDPVINASSPSSQMPPKNKSH